MIKITTLILGLLTLNGFSQEYKSVDEVLGIAIGETVSNFKAITNNADTFELQEALTNGPVLLIFYRGQWCSFCSRYLSKIQDSLSFIEAKGVTVFGVSPEKPTVSVITAEKTKAEFTDDGWFKTGDIGEIDADGFLKITDRKKEMFKTSGGKYIAPQVMENKFKESRFIEQIMVIGEGQKHASALIVPATDFIKEWCKRKGIKNCETDIEISLNERVIERISKEVNHFNESFGKWEQIKKFELLDHQWTIESGELTPTMKPKRKAVKATYQELIDKIYESSSPS